MNPSTESPGSDGPRLGRPRDGALTDRVLSGAQDVVIEQGPDRLSADALAAVTGVSRAAIYRRWPDTAALLAEIVTRCRPVPAIPDTGSLRGDLVGLLEIVLRGGLTETDDVSIVEAVRPDGTTRRFAFGAVRANSLRERDADD